MTILFYWFIGVDMIHIISKACLILPHLDKVINTTPEILRTGDFVCLYSPVEVSILAVKAYRPIPRYSTLSHFLGIGNRFDRKNV